MAFRVKDEAVNNKLAITTKSLLQQLVVELLHQLQCSTCGDFEAEELL